MRRTASPGPPTAGRSPTRCSCPTKARGSARRSSAPKARPGPSRCRSSPPSPTASTAQGYLRPGYEQIFLVSADGGAPRQLSYGAYNNEGPLSWSPDGRTLYFSGNRSENWERDGLNSEIYALDIASNRIAAITSRNGPDNSPAVSPDGRTIAFVGFDDRERGYENTILYVQGT